MLAGIHFRQILAHSASVQWVESIVTELNGQLAIRNITGLTLRMNVRLQVELAGLL